MTVTTPGGLRTGAMVHRDDRAAKNARWYLIDRDGPAKVGWGDVSYDDLARAALNEPR